MGASLAVRLSALPARAVWLLPAFGGRLGWGFFGSLPVNRLGSTRACPHPNLPPEGEGARRRQRARAWQVGCEPRQSRLSGSFPPLGEGGDGSFFGSLPVNRLGSTRACPHPNLPPEGEGARRRQRARAWQVGCEPCQPELLGSFPPLGEGGDGGFLGRCPSTGWVLHLHAPIPTFPQRGKGQEEGSARALQRLSQARRRNAQRVAVLGHGAARTLNALLLEQFGELVV